MLGVAEAECPDCVGGVPHQVNDLPIFSIRMTKYKMKTFLIMTMSTSLCIFVCLIFLNSLLKNHKCPPNNGPLVILTLNL